MFIHKKSILFLLLGICTQDFALANQTGFRVGFQGGFKETSVRHYFKFQPSAALAAIGFKNEYKSRNITDGAPTMGLHIAYDKYFKDCIYTSAELSYRLEGGENRQTLRFTNQPAVIQNETLIISQKLNSEFGFALHLGGLLCADTTGYLILDAKAGRFKESVRQGGVTAVRMLQPSKHKYRFGSGGGFGFKHVMQKHHVIGFEATYDEYEKMKINEDLLSILGSLYTADLRVGSKTPKVYRALLKYSYVF